VQNFQRRSGLEAKNAMEKRGGGGGGV
jgi:hypothetical protein